MANDKLMDTPVTWSDIEHDMQKAFKTRAYFGPHKDIVVIGDGNGFLSKIGLVTAHWQNKEQNEDLPDKFVVKISSSINVLGHLKKLSEDNGDESAYENSPLGTKIAHQVSNLHNFEVTLYNLLDKYHIENFPRTKVYHTVKFDEDNKEKGYILMSCFENVVPIHVWNNLSLDEVRQVVKACAGLQAATLHMSDHELSFFSTKLVEEIFGAFFFGEALGDYMKNFGKFAEERMKHLLDKIEEELERIVNCFFYDSIPERLGMKRVLAHGDLWSTNSLWKKNGTNHELLAIIDFQTSHLGNAVGDITRVFNSMLSGSDRRKYTEQLLAEFYETLREFVGNDDKLPYTFDQLQEAYKQFYPASALILIPMMGGMSDNASKEASPEESEKIITVASEKLQALLEDMLYFYNRSKDLGLM